MVGKLEAMQKKLLADTKASQRRPALQDPARRCAQGDQTHRDCRAGAGALIVSSALPLLFTLGW